MLIGYGNYIRKFRVEIYEKRKFSHSYYVTNINRVQMTTVDDLQFSTYE